MQSNPVRPPNSSKDATSLSLIATSKFLDYAQKRKPRCVLCFAKLSSVEAANKSAAIMTATSFFLKFGRTSTFPQTREFEFTLDIPMLLS
jgi:hypothetical protein